MAMGSSLVALALVSSGGAAAEPAAEGVTYQVKVLTVEGTRWRAAGYHRMHPVARQGTTTVWTADRALADSLARQAKATSATPRTQAGASSTVEQKQDHYYVRHLDRISDGPVNQATAVAFVPEVGTLVEGFQATVSGRRLDQGVLASVNLSDSHIVRVESVTMTESIQGRSDLACAAPEDGSKAAECDVEKEGTRVASQVQIPEVAAGRVEGEWLVPNDSVLLVSLGIHTSADAKGMAVTQERLAIVDFGALPIRPITTADLLPVPTADGQPAMLPTALPFVAAGEPAPIAVANLPQATPPSRSLPRSIDVDGKVVELPPLPEAVASADLNQIPPGSPLASPQMRPRAGMADPALARTSFARTAVAPPAQPATPALTLGAFTSTSNTLIEFSKKLMERMPEYEMDIDVSSDGRACQVTFRDDAVTRAVAETPCPPEPRCDNGKDDDEAPLVALVRSAFESLRDAQAGQSFDFNIASGPKADGAVRPVALGRGGIDLDLNIKTGQVIARPLASADCPICPACSTDAACDEGDGSPLEFVMDVIEGLRDLMAYQLQANRPAQPSRTVTLQSALQAPGRTETTLIPMGDKFSLEIKATIVPTPAAAATASTKSEATPR